MPTSVKRTAAATPYRFRDLLALDDFERHAKRLLPHMIYQYVAGGAETGSAMRAESRGLRRLRVLPRMHGRHVRSHARRRSLFGRSYDAPFGIGPLGGAAFIAYRGDLALAEAARQATSR